MGGRPVVYCRTAVTRNKQHAPWIQTRCGFPGKGRETRSALGLLVPTGRQTGEQERAQQVHCSSAGFQRCSTGLSDVV